MRLLGSAEQLPTLKRPRESIQPDYATGRSAETATTTLRIISDTVVTIHNTLDVCELWLVLAGWLACRMK
jgi:hypothetical protein